MAEQQHRATPQQWRDVKAMSFGSLAYSTILELRDRIKALEAAVDRAASEAYRAASTEVRPSEVSATEAKSNHPEKPDSSLVERVAAAITGDSDGPINWKPEARAAIREVAAWLRERARYGGWFWSQLLQQESER